ncbi:MAG: M14 family metallopeptidase [Longimicrobiales bacterium]|nr:M14 family metallopeptidase [Longimicrobiales bacterium]
MKRAALRAAAVLALVALPVCAPHLHAQAIPTPVQHFGFEPGTDRNLADWHQLTAFYEALARGSGRVRVDTLGTSTRGLPFVMVTVTSAANQARLDELRAIQMKLADPRTVSGEAELERLLERGRAVVLITHQIHSTEVGGGQMAARLLHRLATAEDERTRRILDNVILLDIPALNPDGLQWVAEWYNRFKGTEYEGAPLPWLYHAYVGHDNNRDWYAFTQVETQLTVEKAHNAWHPQIVHDVHQMGGNGARIFFPPYIEPWEPNVDPALTAAVNQLGSYMAAALQAEGKQGVVVNAQYDAYTPARAYQHYHAGARILSETASARLATSVTVPPERLGPGRGFDASRRSWNYPDPWPGGEWGLSEIVDYMESGALALLDNAAKNRRYWLENFWGIGVRAVEGWPTWPAAWVIPRTPRAEADRAGLDYLLRILAMGEVEVRRAGEAFQADGERFPAGSWVVEMRQPYAAFAQTLLERQVYPDLREYPGGPPLRPYDVTAHTLPLLMDVEAVPVRAVPQVTLSEPIAPPEWSFTLPEALTGADAPRVAIYKGWRESMEAGWTRWVFDRHGLAYDTLHDADLRAGDLAERWDVILLQSQGPDQIRGGFEAGTLPAEYTGGVGERGLTALRDFVVNGGRLVAVEEATDLAVELFGLGVANRVERLPPQDFYIPGSILAVELEETPFAEGLRPDASAWYWRSSRAFDVSDPTVEVLARYSPAPLLSGWALGADRVAGRPALVRASVGRGSVVLFGFQPNYRGQTVSTWPLLFRALAHRP